MSFYGIIIGGRLLGRIGLRIETRFCPRERLVERDVVHESWRSHHTVSDELAKSHHISLFQWKDYGIGKPK